MTSPSQSTDVIMGDAGTFPANSAKRKFDGLGEATDSASSKRAKIGEAVEDVQPKDTQDLGPYYKLMQKGHESCREYPFHLANI